MQDLVLNSLVLNKSYCSQLSLGQKKERLSLKRIRLKEEMELDGK